jgi:anti-anti-sigma factor
MATNKTPRLQVEAERQAARTVVHCTGQVDIDTWSEFSTTIRALIPEGKPIRVDLAKITRADSTGIGAFVGVWTAARRRNCDLKYINPNKRIEDVIGITGLLGMFEGREAEEQRLGASLGSRGR